MTRRRPPAPAQLDQWAVDLDELARRLADPATHRTLRTIWDATQDAYPHRHGAPPEGRTATGGGSGEPRPRQPVATHAERVLAACDTLHTATRLVLAALDQWAPGRAVACCPRCGNPMDRAYTRCQHVDDDGVQCGARPESTPCVDCGVDVPRGKVRKGRCDACRKHVDRHGRPRVATVDRLALDGVIVGGVYAPA